MIVNSFLTETYSIPGGFLELVLGDITKIYADVIVNAANSELRAGSGVCGAIYGAAGLERLQEETLKIGRCSTGRAVSTPAFNLPAKYIFHAVGPIYEDGFAGEDILLRATYDSCYGLLVKVNNSKLQNPGQVCMSISFPAISTGVYKYPIREATKIAVTSAIEFTKHVLSNSSTGFMTKFVCFTEADFLVYKDVIKMFTNITTKIF